MLPRAQKKILGAAEALAAPIRRIALTHGHGDHIGSLDALAAALPGVEVLISRATRACWRRTSRSIPASRRTRSAAACRARRPARRACSSRRPRRLARGPRRARPHAGPDRVPRPARPHAVLRRRVRDARRRRDVRQAAPALPADGLRDLAQADRAGEAPGRCARSTPPGSRPATARSSSAGPRDGPRDRARGLAVARRGLDARRSSAPRSRSPTPTGSRRSRSRAWPPRSACARHRSTTTSPGARV